ncbi:Uncharacterised protein [Yersinia massiliensis]|nr:Uncharacterised protein [Yersinia massiliensis]
MTNKVTGAEFSTHPALLAHRAGNGEYILITACAAGDQQVIRGQHQ